MKKILLILCLLISLSGCAAISSKVDAFKLKRLGYQEEDIVKIQTLSEQSQERFLTEYNDKLVLVMNLNGFKEENFNKYLTFLGKFDNDKMVKFVNEGILNETTCSKLEELYASKYYLAKNEELYLKYLNDYDNARDLLEIVNTKRYKELFSDITKTDISKDYLMLINKYYQLPEDYEPEDLVEIDPHYGTGRTRKEVYEQYKLLQDDGNELGYVFTICSAYRSYAYQDGLYQMYLDDEGDVAIVDTHSARPGHSEHQSGLCLDLTTPGYGMDNFGDSDSGKWVIENCAKYGFIIRYTADKENITGYQSEPWQIRYVGSKDIAQEIMDTGITFDEYYACFVEE